MEMRVHISLEVSDIQKSIAFYSALFQREPSKVRADYANFRMEGPDLHLALVHVPNHKPEKVVSRHYGVELFEDDKLKSWLTSAENAGIKPRIEQNVTCCYAVANKFWAQDPDGNEWEFWVRKDEADSMTAVQPKETKASACCAPGTCC